MGKSAFDLVRMILVDFLVAPFLALLWRARRYLADATAVQLTRYPDGLARAIAKLAPDGDLAPADAWASHLFIAGHENALVSFNPPVTRRLRRLQDMGAGRDASAEAGGTLHRAHLALLLVLLGPLAVLVWVVMLGVALAITGICLAIYGLFLAPMVGVLHALLR